LGLFQGSSAAIGHTLENSIPLSIFPVSPDKFCIAFCGLPGNMMHIPLFAYSSPLFSLFS
jgi:hypothetical protein